jgi:GTPase SAR1 family protein
MFRQIKALIGKKQDGRTRGIEISVLADADITISIWDLAGQEEFHAFHDYMMPNLGDITNPCSFLFVFDPTIHEEHHEKIHHRKELQELQETLLYWLRFVASNTPVSTTYRPQFNVILTHADQDSDASGLSIWAESNVVKNLRTQFEKVVDISIKVHAIDALSRENVQPLLDFLFQNSRGLLSKTPLVFKESARLQHALQKEAKRHPNRPFMSWKAFCQLCAQTIPNIYYVTNTVNNGERFDLVKSEERAKAIAAHLHEIGNIIYFPGLKWVVINPNWFGHDIMGCVINFGNTQHSIDDGKGFTSKDYIEHILNQSMISKHISSGSNGSIGPNDLLQFMLHLNMCYEKEPGKLEAGVFIPTTLRPKNPSTIKEGERQLCWPKSTSLISKETIFLGRRLESNDPFHTFLTPGFFPRLQVMYQYILIPCILNYFELIT